MNYNPNIHHRKSVRLKEYDYSKEGLYFITICCDARNHLFGGIVDGKMILYDAGKIANQCWLDIPNHFPNAILHEHIIMPNHVHGIIELKSPHVGVEYIQPLRTHHEFQKIIPRSIGSIVRGYKIGVTKWFRNNRAENFPPPQVWQRNYYEHIIRNEKSYLTISNYIVNNPKNWKDDKFNKE